MYLYPCAHVTRVSMLSRAEQYDKSYLHNTGKPIMYTFYMFIV